MQHNDAPTTGDLPVALILGFPRSGTSWFGNLLNSHPAVIYRHEHLGRRLAGLDPRLIAALKTDCGLSAQQRGRLIAEFLRPTPDVDRPPFFPKSGFSAALPHARWLAWLAARYMPALARAYEHAFSPALDDERVLILKETRSSKNMYSILKGIAPTNVLHLIRNPYAVVASHLEGFEAGTMPRPGCELRMNWYRDHADRDAVARLGLEARDIVAMDDSGFIGLQWCVYNEDILRVCNFMEVGVRVGYENLNRDPLGVTEAVLAVLGLDIHEQVVRFIETSRSSQAPRLVGRDASSEYFSVYRRPGFDPDRWVATLTEGQKIAVADMLDGSPLISSAVYPDAAIDIRDGDGRYRLATAGLPATTNRTAFQPGGP